MREVSMGVWGGEVTMGRRRCSYERSQHGSVWRGQHVMGNEWPQIIMEERYRSILTCCNHSSEVLCHRGMDHLTRADQSEEGVAC